MTEATVPPLDTLEVIRNGGRIIFENPWNNPEAFQVGLERAQTYLSGPQTAIIGGSTVRSDDAFHHYNPSTAEEFGPAFVTNITGLQEALRIASGENRAWSDPNRLSDRVKVIDRFGAALATDRDVLMGLMTLSQGKNGMEAWRDAQELIDFVTEYRRMPQVRDYLRAGLRSDGKTTLQPEPAGVVGVWAPFNFTCIGGGETIAAILAGNSVVFHPSPRNIGPYRYLAEKLLEAGVPADRLQFVIPDPADPAMSKALAADPRINQISFTGSHKVGLELDQIMAEKRRVTGRLDYRLDIEAGGRNPIIVAGVPGGDLEYALERIVDSMTGYQGQKCSALGELLIIGEELGDNITEAVVERLRKLRIRPTTDPESEMGAVIDLRALGLIQEQVKQVVADGGQIITGGQPHQDLPGAVIPTLYRDLPSTSNMANAEVFGPVAQVRVVRSIDEAVKRANNMGYALTAGVMAQEIEEAQEIASRLHHGVTYVNDGCTAAPVPEMPFGGSGFSGTGTLLKPGSAGHPLQFTRVRSVATLPRNQW